MDRAAAGSQVRGRRAPGGSMSTSAEAARGQEVRERLATVREPDLDKDLVTLGMVKDIKINDGRVAYTLVLTTPAHPLKNDLREATRAAVAELPWVSQVDV